MSFDDGCFYSVIENDGCADNPCMNGGSCIKDPNTCGAYTCECSPCHGGDNCELGKCRILDQCFYTILVND